MATNLFAAPTGLSKPLVEFRAGKMNQNGNQLVADQRKGLLQLVQSPDSLIHLIWKDRTTGANVDDLIIFPEEAVFKQVKQVSTGRVMLLEFKASTRRLFFWVQEPKADKDEEYVTKINQYINNPPNPEQEQPSLGSAGLRQMMDRLARRPPATPVTPMPTTSTQPATPSAPVAAPATQPASTPVPFTPLSATAKASSSSTTTTAATAPTTTSSVVPPSTPTTATSTSTTTTTNTNNNTNTPVPATPLQSAVPSTSTTTTATTAPTTAAQPMGSIGGNSGGNAVQLSALQDILASFGVNPSGGVSRQNDIHLSDVIDIDKIMPVLTDPEVQEQLLPLLPEGQNNTRELFSSMRSPQVQQALDVFTRAIQSGDLGEMMHELGITEFVMTVDQFLRGLQSSVDKTKTSESNAKKQKTDDSMETN